MVLALRAALLRKIEMGRIRGKPKRPRPPGPPPSQRPATETATFLKRWDPKTGRWKTDPLDEQDGQKSKKSKKTKKLPPGEIIRELDI